MFRQNRAPENDMRSGGNFSLWAALAAVAVAALAGCRAPALTFPAQPLRADANAVVYDTDGDGHGDCFFLLDSAGRAVSLKTARPGGDGGNERIVELDKLPISRCRHVVIILDGVGYDLVKDFQQAGHLRMFHPPSRVIAPYPTLTDLCFEDFLGLGPVKGMEAQYYDRRKNEIVGGSGDYLDANKLPYNRILNYRADTLMDALCYLYPESVFLKDINDAKRLIDRNLTREVLVYLVSSAGLGTIDGPDGHRQALAGVERLVSQVLWETDGLCKFTLLSDHGHTYAPARRIDMEQHLEAKGWNLSDRVKSDRDVAYVRFGLETYLSLSGRRPAELAADAVTCPGAELASYAENGRVVVLDAAGGRAVIGRKADRYSYRALSGDPLKLKDILSSLRADADGYYDANEMLAGTCTHSYPAGSERLWRAHFATVENPPDVIVSLADDYYSGSRGLGGFVKVASTHGGLNCRNSTAFIMSTAGPLPPLMRSREIPANMTRLTGQAWPLRK
jgi:hypothetical protein